MITEKLQLNVGTERKSCLKDNLRFLRKNANLKQHDIANYIGVAVSTYSSYENGAIEPNIERLILLADLYNISLDELVGRKFVDKEGLLEQINITTKEVLSEIINDIIKQKRK